MSKSSRARRGMCESRDDLQSGAASAPAPAPCRLRASSARFRSSRRVVAAAAVSRGLYYLLGECASASSCRRASPRNRRPWRRIDEGGGRGLRARSQYVDGAMILGDAAGGFFNAPPSSSGRPTWRLTPSDDDRHRRRYFRCAAIGNVSCGSACSAIFKAIAGAARPASSRAPGHGVARRLTVDGGET